MQRKDDNDAESITYVKVNKMIENIMKLWYGLNMILTEHMFI